MSNFHCEHCGALCADSEHGYITGCEHYPPDVAAIGKAAPKPKEEDNKTEEEQP